jgi:hypothetical protein
MTYPRRRGLSAIAFAVFAAPAAAQPAPPSPTYDAVIRYRIDADRDGRVLQFRAMTANLARTGFVRTPGDDGHLDAFDPAADRLTGTVPAGTATSLLEDPRVLTVLLTPSGAPAPGPTAQISAALGGGLFPEQQRTLHAQAVAQLAKLGFRENVGYDHKGFTRVRGAIPSNAVPSLVKDLRGLPAGWFAPASSRADLPLPIRSVNPLRLVEVLPAAPDAVAAVPVETAKGKLTAEIVKLTADPATKDTPARVELILNDVPAGGLPAVADRLNLVANGATVEGFMGQSLAVRVAKAADAAEFARLPEVRHVRLPRAVSETARPVAAASGSDPVVSTGVSKLHQRGYYGAGIKAVVIATGFPGLPANASNLVDLTAELSPTLEPLPADPRHPGTGTAAAMALRAAAPSADLILVRVDPYAFHQLITVARAATSSGESEALRVRLSELTKRSATLGERRKAVMDEYAAAMRNISDDEKPLKRREAAKAAYDAMRSEETRFQATFDRFKRLRAGLQSLSSAAVVVNTVVSEVGQPHDGLSALNAALSETFAAKPQRSALRPNYAPPPPVWVQAAGFAPNAVWAGAFADTDGNGVLEFAPAAPRGLWTPELNFLTITGPDGAATGDLPAGVAVRVTAQWREPIDPAAGVDSSRTPLTLRLLRQLTSAGAADELVEVARAAGPPVRIHTTATAGVFEQTLDFTVPTAGRYALRVEAPKADPGLGPVAELTPRIVIDANNADTAAKGRLGFAVATANAGVGIPGESPLVTTVGTVGSQRGAGPGVALLAKPDVFAPATGPEGKTVGPAVAAGTVGGAMACLAGAGYRPKNLPQTLGLPPGADLQFGDLFLQYLPQR